MRSLHPVPYPGYTLIELVVVLAIIAILMSLIVVKTPFLSQRQQTLNEARKIGLLIENWRERAQAEENTYSLRIDLDSGNYQVFRVAGENQPANMVREGQLTPPLSFGAARVGSQALPSPVVFTFSPDGLMPEAELDLKEAQKPGITLHINPLCNEVSYIEHQ